MGPSWLPTCWHMPLTSLHVALPAAVLTTGHTALLLTVPAGTGTLRLTTTIIIIVVVVGVHIVITVNTCN